MLVCLVDVTDDDTGVADIFEINVVLGKEDFGGVDVLAVDFGKQEVLQTGTLVSPGLGTEFVFEDGEFLRGGGISLVSSDCCLVVCLTAGCDTNGFMSGVDNDGLNEDVDTGCLATDIDTGCLATGTPVPG